MKSRNRAADDLERARKEEAWRQDAERRALTGQPPQQTMVTQTGVGAPPPSIRVTVQPGPPPVQPAVIVHTQQVGAPAYQQQPQFPQPQVQAQPQPQAQQVQNIPPPPEGISPEVWLNALALAQAQQNGGQQMPGQPPGMIPGQVWVDPSQFNLQPGGVPVEATVTTAPAAQVQRNLAVILSSHMRPQMTEQQLLKLRQQTIHAKRIVFLVSPGLSANEALLSSQETVRTSFPFTPWRRFYEAAMQDAEWVAILDDDTIPGSRWLEAALDYLKDNTNDVVAARGVKLDDSLGEHMVGPGQEPQEITEVDYGENGWVLSRQKLVDLLGMDILGSNGAFGWSVHLGWAAKQQGGKTVVLPYGTQTAGMLQGPARDTVSLRRAPIWADKHHEILRHYRNAGWLLAGGTPS